MIGIEAATGRRTLARATAALTAALAFACGGAGSDGHPPSSITPAAVAPVASHPASTAPASSTSAREAPPPSGPERLSAFPTITRRTLANGLEIAAVAVHALPIVQLRVVIGVGTGYGGHPGVASLTGEMLKHGGTRALTGAAMLDRVSAMGASLGVSVDADATVVSLGVAREHLADALAIVADVVSAPRFDEADFKHLQPRDVERARARLRESGTAAAMQLVFRELFTETNPYATHAPLPSELASVSLARVRELHKRFFTPKNARVVVVGDIDATALAAAAESAFGAWRGGDAPIVSFPPSIPLARTRVVLADRPGNAQSDIFVATMAPGRASADMPAARVANQVLGGGMGSRLFLDVREQRALAHRTQSWVVELAHGPQPLIAYVGTQTAKTAESVAAVLESFARLKREPIAAIEVEAAGRSIRDAFAVRTETLAGVADLVVDQAALRVPDGYWDRYREAIRAVDAKSAAAAAAKLFAVDKALIVVAGDASKIGESLARFGEVTVVDPAAELATVKTIAAETGKAE